MKIVLRYPPRLGHHRWEHRWYKLRYGKYEFECDDVRDKIDDAVDWLLKQYQRKICNPLNRFLEKIWLKDTIRIDYQDLWSLDHTLSLIIHPALVRLKEIKHGSPMVDDDDVPEHIRAGKPVEDQYNSEPNDHVHDRWEYVLGEMIWAFEQLTKHGNDDQFHHNADQLEMVTKPLEDNPKLYSVDFNHQKDPSKPKYWVDREGKKAHHERIANGLRLFGKYYQGLWD